MIGERDGVRVTMRLRVFVYKEQVDALAAALRRPPCHGLLRGGGPDVSGPLVSLILAMAGRTASYDDLVGEGVPILVARG